MGSVKDQRVSVIVGTLAAWFCEARTPATKPTTKMATQTLATVIELMSVMLMNYST